MEPVVPLTPRRISLRPSIALSEGIEAILSTDDHVLTRGGTRSQTPKYYRPGRQAWFFQSWGWQHPLILSVLMFLSAVGWCQVGTYVFAASRCSYPGGLAEGLPTMILSDVHMLGHQRRSVIARSWVDWQIHMAFTINDWIHSPALVINLGDQFDEGGPSTSGKEYEDYGKRYLRLFNEKRVLRDPIANRFIYQLGNHDASFGPSLTRRGVSRYETIFGNANGLYVHSGLYFAVINSLILDSPSNRLYNTTRDFIEALASDQHHDPKPLIMLLHLPLYRPNDLNCGNERSLESGHVTYEAPEFNYTVGHHVLSPNTSQALLHHLNPSFVFSGHTHAICHTSHAVDSSSSSRIQEVTVPAFSWGQRPDPSYILARVDTQGHVKVKTCHLPVESTVFLTYVLVATLVLFHTLVQLGVKVRQRQHPPQWGEKCH